MRCKYAKQCNYFDNLSKICTSKDGSYYSNGGKCGVYREFERKENE